MTVGILLCATALAWGTQAEELSAANVGADTTSVRDVERPFHEVHGDLRDALRREAEATDPREWAATVLQLTDLYCEIMRDPRLSASGTLQGYRVKLRSRLLKIQKQLERDIERLARGKPLSTTDDPLQRTGGAQLVALLWLSGDSLGGPATYYRIGRSGGWAQAVPRVPTMVPRWWS